MRRKHNEKDAQQEGDITRGEHFPPREVDDGGKGGGEDHTEEEIEALGQMERVGEWVGVIFRIIFIIIAVVIVLLLLIIIIIIIQAVG